MRVTRTPCATNLEVVELSGKSAKDHRSPIARAVIDDVNAVAEGNDIPHDSLDEDVLVSDEHDPDDLQTYSSAARERRYSPAQVRN